MKLKELIERTSLKAAGLRAGLDVRMVEGLLMCTPIDPDDSRYTLDFVLPSMKMVEACRADDFDFFQPFIDAGKITVEDMHRAAARYHLGKTKSGQPLFWMIDDMRDPQDAHIMPDTWISTLLKAREPLLRYWRPTHCLFGLHLLCHTDHTDHIGNFSSNGRASTNDKASVGPVRAVCNTPVCVVESEASAVVLSELIPESLWMAYASMSFLSVEFFAPLMGRTVTVYPPTDASFATFPFFDELATAVRKRYRMNITVATLLEDHATDEQKARGIDLLDFLREAIGGRTHPSPPHGSPR